MKIGFKLILYLMILNMVSGLMYITSVPGTGYSQILSGTGSPEEYAERFSPSGFMNATNPGISAIISFVGHLLSAIDVMWTGIRFTVLGFPTMLQQIGLQIGDPDAKAAFTNVSNVLYAVFSAIIFIWLFQLVTGREVEN